MTTPGGPIVSLRAALILFGGVIVAAAAGIWTWRFDPGVAAGTAVVSFAGTVMFLNSIIES
ncbi:hypothetical protein AB0K47_13585 [Streptomyces tirandamycinicus]|uniref:hypothetical protein n=1 Tax=Streptomyces TaxID=1883 RepID=UPI003444C21A